MSNKSGNYIEIAGGSITEHCTGEYNLFAQKMSFNAEGTVSINGAQKGTSYKTPIEPPKIVLNLGKVKKVELVTNLDLGSKNDKSRGTQLGMIFGKEYTFQVTQYDNETPLTRRLTKWQIRYHSPKYSQNKWIDVPLKVTGDTVKITLNEEDMCGRFIYVRAYIDDPKSEGEIKVWKHNRFRWFDREILEEEIEERTTKGMPWKVNQAGTSLCGMACIFYLFAKEKPNDYKKFAFELFRTGEATFNSYTSKPSKEVTEKKVNKNGFPLNTGGMPLVDYVTMAGTRNTGNPDYKGGDEQFNAINTPWFMDELCTNLLGYKEVSSINSYDIAKKGKSIYNLVSSSSYHKKIQRLIDSLNEKLSKGYRLILNIDSDLISPDEDYHIPNNIFDKAEWKKTRKTTFEPEYHWIVLESPIESMITNLDKNGEVYYTINFKVFTWGMPIGTYLKTPITYDHFYTNFYGDIYAK